ncbi:MAG: glycosyltransferase family 2 protein [Euryarchaeota archaeon]
MYGDWKIGVVIPAKDEEKHLQEVLDTLPKYVDHVVVIDDGSKDKTAEIAVNHNLVQLSGEGVGAAIDAGHQKLLEIIDEQFISVVVAGDGQMDPNDMENVISPIINRRADHVKGERLDRQGKMPLIRQIGTFILGFLTTLACGQRISDPQCGYTATNSKVLKKWNWNNSWKGYGYPNYWLMNIAAQGWKIEHVPVKAIYSGQKSGLRILTFLPKVSIMLLIGLHARIISNTFSNPSFFILFVWATYVLAWIYNPIILVFTHIFDRLHVKSIMRDLND